MALRIRRGTDAQRGSRSFEPGELVWTTDTHQLWVGGLPSDGNPLGGISIVSNVAGYGLLYNNITHKLEVSGLTTDDISEGNKKYFSTELAVDAVGAALVAGNATNVGITFTYAQTQDDAGRINATVQFDGVGITDVVADLSPQLGGELDLNGFDITGNGVINTNKEISNSKIYTTTVSSVGTTITLASTTGLFPGMPIVFGLTNPSSPALGSIVAYKLYYVKTVVDNDITISTIIGGSAFTVGTSSAVMEVTANGIITNIIEASDLHLEGMLVMPDMSGSPTTNHIYTQDGFLQVGLKTQPVSMIFNVDAVSGDPFVIKGITGGATTTNVRLAVQRGSLLAPTVVQNGDLLGSILFSGYTGTTSMNGYANSAVIGAYVDEAGTLTNQTDILGTVFFGSTEDINSGKATVVLPGGILSAPIFKATSYATGSLPSSPAEGYMVFDSTTKEFKGWNGTAWVVLG